MAQQENSGFGHDSDTMTSFDTEINILTKENMNKFTFSGYPNTNTGNSNPKSIADQINRTSTDSWPNYGYQTGQDSNGVAYIQIDLKSPYYITKYAVSGYPGSQHRPINVWYLRASNDAENWINIGMSDINTWCNDGKGTYPFRYIQQVTDPGFYRYYQFYGVGFDNKYLLIMNAGLWTPQKMNFNKWKLCQSGSDDTKTDERIDYNISSYHPLVKWENNHIIYWITNMINWGNKTDEKLKCIQELKDWSFKGQDLIKADKQILNTLGIENPLIQQRILTARDQILQNPHIVKQVLEACDDKKLQLELIQNEIQSIKSQLSELKMKINQDDEKDNIIIESGTLNLAETWTHYGGDFKQAKWFKIGKIVIVQGLVTSNQFASKKHIATLPENCWPKQRLIFNLDQHSVSFRVDVATNGNIVWQIGNNTHNWISLSGITFIVD